MRKATVLCVILFALAILSFVGMTFIRSSSELTLYNNPKHQVSFQYPSSFRLQYEHEGDWGARCRLVAWFGDPRDVDSPEEKPGMALRFCLYGTYDGRKLTLEEEAARDYPAYPHVPVTFGQCRAITVDFKAGGWNDGRDGLSYFSELPSGEIINFEFANVRKANLTSADLRQLVETSFNGCHFDPHTI